MFNGYSEFFRANLYVEIAAYNELGLELQWEKLLLKGKYHIIWLKDGDWNFAYFHHVLKARKVNRPLHSLRINGDIVSDR